MLYNEDVERRCGKEMRCVAAHIKCILKGGGLLSGSATGRINYEMKTTKGLE